jgi:nucleoside-diphosphate-sugar epimerase
MTDSFSGKTALVTGGTGFIGQYLASVLLRKGANVIVLSRNPRPPGSTSCKIVTGDLMRPSTFKGICAGVDTVFHLGGHAHAIDEPDGEGATTNSRVTVEGTRFLLEESRQAGVRTFIFFSSVKAMGEGGESCLDETVESRPVTAYGKAKHEAEKLVLNTALKTTVLRLPMVYGRGCKGNLPRMIQAVARGRFPPLPETGNRRSMVDVRDVVQAALLAATNPMAAGKTYIVTDGQAYSTRQIYEWICGALQVSVPRWTIPLPVLRIAACFGDIIGRIKGRRFIFDTSALDKLTGSAWYSSEKISRELNYRPVRTLKDSLPEMVMQLHRIA